MKTGQTGKHYPRRRMEYWEFLIQKEGDRSWLPLETPEVEILEGRYRVVARSSNVNETVEIRVSYQSAYEEPSKRRVQKRSSNTNAEGLIVVIPFTHLKPGFWELHCSGDSTSDRPEWQHAVSLEVLSSDAEVGDASTVQPPAKSAEPPDVEEPEPTQFPRIASKEIAPQLNAPAAPAAATGKSTPSQRVLQLSLNRDTYMRRRGQPITLSGRVEVTGAPAAPVPLKGAKLHVQLRDPQTSQVLVNLQQSLPQLVPPVPFSCGLEIPADSQNSLILGEIALYEGTSEAVDAKSFSIAPDVEDLLDAIDEDLIKELTIEPQESPDEVFHNLLETLQNPQSVQFKPSTERPLPPQLYKPTSEQAASKPLDLPSFPRVKPDAAIAKSKQPPAAEPAPPTEEPESEPDIAQTEEETAEAAVSETPQQAQSSLPELTSEPANTPLPSRKLQERFLSRLNALANDAELTEWLKAELPPVVEAAPDGTAEAQAAPKTAADWEAREVVIFEEFVEAPRSQAGALQKGTAAPAGDANELLVLPEDEPVPTPVLHVPQENLIAGRSVAVFVRLPDLLPRIYVKVWLQDRQSRLVLDGPHWVTEFSYNAWGDLEGTVQVMVPLGSFQVQFEAIAMETLTKRESHKVSLSRQVIPPAAPSLPMQ